MPDNKNGEKQDEERAAIVNKDTLVKPIICEAQVLVILDRIKSRYPMIMWSWIESEVALIEDEDGEVSMEWNE